MGTRNLICVFYRGKFVLAQYSQWDGSSEGQGVIILKFLLDAANIEYLKSGLEHIYLPDDDEMKQIETDVRRVAEENPRCKVSGIPLDQALNMVSPSLSRDTGGKILQIVAKATAENRVPIQLTLDFANDGLFCEWAYVVDLDDGTLEVSGGAVKKAKAKSKRFNDVGGIRFSSWLSASRSLSFPRRRISWRDSRPRVITMVTERPPFPVQVL